MGKSSQAKTRAEVKKALEMFAENPALTFTDVSHALGYTHSAVSKWYARNTAGFKDSYDELLKMRFAELESPAITALGELVKDKNFNAVKYVLDNRGYKPVEKIEANVATDIVINIGE
jgi:hypothetical protein